MSAGHRRHDRASGLPSVRNLRCDMSGKGLQLCRHGSQGIIMLIHMIQLRDLLSKVSFFSTVVLRLCILNI